MSKTLTVLVVDDDRLGRVSTVKQLQSSGYQAAAAESAYAALAAMEESPSDVVLTDLRMPGMDGEELLREVKRRWPSTEVVLMTAYGTVQTAVRSMREGASDYLLKPYSHAELEVRLERFRDLAESRRELEALRGLLGDKTVEMRGMVGNSPQLQQVWERIRCFADSDAPVLVFGETGTGKELVARALHEESGRASGPFIPIGCGTIPGELAESEFFGHERGAFTGAIASHEGCFERAHHGTVLLDDVDDLALDLQVKLLRVLQEGTFTRVGGTQEIAVDVRVIATTKTDLEDRVETHTFRSDLFYRLRGLEVLLAPLRERGSDILLLAHRFLDQAAQKGGGSVPVLTPEAADILMKYAWPGNVRELRRAMESIVVMSAGRSVTPELLPDFLKQHRGPDRRFQLELSGCEEVSFSELTSQFEGELLQWAMRRSGGNQLEAARLLGIPRTTFQSKMANRQKGL